MDLEPLTPEQKVIKALSSPDSILEPDVLDTLRAYLKLSTAEAKIPKAIAFLNNSYQGLASMSNLVVTWLQTVGVSSLEIQNIIEDYINEQVVQRFDPKKADQIMEAEETPDWVPEIIPIPKWRQLIYKLSQEHRKCDLLNFSIQGISNAGYHTEIAALESASIYLSVFNRVLCELTSNILKAPNEREFQNLLPSFKQMCNHNEHTYTYAQSILHLLSKEENGENVRRLSQELYNDVKELPLAQQLAILIEEYGNYPDDLKDSISTVLRDQEVSQGNCKKLYNLYSGPSPPPVRYLRQAPILNLFMKELFGMNKVLPPYNQYYYYLLAYVSCKSDAYEMTEQEKDEIDTVSGVLSKLMTNHRPQLVGVELQSFALQFQQELQQPMISMCALHWIGLSLRDPIWYSTNLTTGALDILLDLIYEISRLHESQHLHVLELEVASFELFELDTGLEGEEALEIRKKMLDAMVYLMECGCVLSVLDKVVDWAKGSTVDLSLLRYFTTKVLEMVGPPFSVDFLGLILTLIDSLSSSVFDLNYMNALQPFLEHCQTLHHLSPEQHRIIAHVVTKLKESETTSLRVSRN